MIDEMAFADEEELIEEDDVMIIDDFKVTSSEESTLPSKSSDESLFEPDEKKRKYSVVPLDTKVKVITLAKLHPTWTLSTLQKRGFQLFKRKDQLINWERDIQKGRTL
uniref:uncharacterized protein LOC117609772 n=1 Tax=Osmia lignaria TaxID=473952 RepID=UPI001478178C|nr:uncharacterized protein LOC117609772 [Osmia lignaria]